MTKLNIKKKFLALLISGNILLTGCSMSGKVTNKKESSSNSSYSYSSIAEDTEIESSFEQSSKIESSLDLKQSNESSEESIILDESSKKPTYYVTLTKRDDNNKEYNDNYNFEVTSEINEPSVEKFSKEIEESSILESSEEDTYNEIYTDDDKYIIANDYVNVRNKPNPDSEILGLLYKNDTLKKLGYTNEYYIVEYNGKKAYATMDCTNEIDKKIIINNPKLNIKDICYFPNGSILYGDRNLTNEIKEIPSLESGEIYYKDDNIYYIETEGQKGYVSKNTATIISQPVVVVDESDQISTLFKNNEKKLEFSVVTGDINTPTTKGLSEIYYVSYDATLAGATWEVDVGVFMPFTIWGEGFHDAWWRSDSEFGGTTYQGNGSHGCVNCKYNDAMALAREVKDSMNNGNKCKVLVKR